MRISDLAKEEPFLNCKIDGQCKLVHQAGVNKFDHHRYGKYYDMLFNPLVDKPCKVMEIGISGGFSLLLWDAFLEHPDAHIVGVDPLYDRQLDQYLATRNQDGFHLTEKDLRHEQSKINHRLRGFETNLNNYSNRVQIHLTNAYTEETTSLFNNDAFDIIIDDGSHTIEDKKYFISNYWPKVKPGGWLVVEDFWWMYDFEILINVQELPQKEVGEIIIYNNEMREEMIASGAYGEGCREGMICVQKKITK